MVGVGQGSPIAVLGFLCVSAVSGHCAIYLSGENML